MTYKWPKSAGSCGYDVINRESVRALKRLRKSRMFIVNIDDFPDMSCDLCKKPVTKETGNRATYYPESKVLEVLHYECSWMSLLGQVHSIDGTARVHVGHLEFVYINGNPVGLA